MDDDFESPIENVSDKLEIAEFCLEAVKRGARMLEYVPEEFKTTELCLEAVKDGRALEYVPNKLKTAELCLNAVKESGGALELCLINSKQRNSVLKR
jgi:hypothetical protein